MKKFYALVLALFISSTSMAQEERAFETRASFNMNGDIHMIGNILISCDGSDSDCVDDRNGAGDNNQSMLYVNADPTAGFSNSSAATLTLPNNSNLLYAALYWGARADDSDSNRNTIQIRVPGSATYTTVTATQLDTYSDGGSDTSRPYQAMADITSLVSNAGNGQYWVGDLAALEGSDGLGYFGGWSIALIYQDNNKPYRRLMLFDGAVRVTGNNNTVNVTIPNIITPQSGAFDTHLGTLVWEGDESISGDSLVFEGLTVSNGINSSNNFWNSSISEFNSHVTTKVPNYQNQLGMDIDMVDVSGQLPNGLTDADIDFVTSGDWYYANVLMFSTELHVPDFGNSISKIANDINGGDVLAGDVIEYTISFDNDGEDTAINTVLMDPLPSNTTYVPNSLSIVSADAGPTGAMTDASGDDAAEYDSINNEVIFRLGSGADQSNGGSIAFGEGVSVRFQVTVDPYVAEGDILNVAEVMSNSMTLPSDDFQVFAQNTITLVDNTAPNPPVISTPAQNAYVNDNTPTVTGTSEPNATISIVASSGETCTTQADSNGNWSCTFTQTMVDGGKQLTVTATDASGNISNGSFRDFILDTTTPSAPSIDTPTNGAPVSGTGEPGATVTVTTPSGATCTALVQPNGTWSCDLVGGPLVDGENITAYQTDPAGNDSPDTTVNNGIDITPPAAPVCSVSPNPANNGTVLTATCTNVESGANISIPGYVCGNESGNEVVCTATAGQGGVDGDEVATVTDPAGNSNTTPAAFVLDNTPPAAPVCTVSPNPANNGTTLTATCTNVESGASISIPGYVCGNESGNEVVCTATAGQGGVDGDEVATITDPAGNTNTTPATFVLDNTPPAAPVCTVSPNPANNGTTLTATCTNVESGASISIPGYVCGNESGNEVVCTATAGQGGVDGDEVATITDPAGNTNTTPATFVLDNTPPAAPVCSVSPNPANNGTTLTATCTNVESGASLSIPGYVCGNESGNEVVCTATAGQGGVDGDEVATVTDPAGNSNTAPASFVLDNTAPVAPVITTPLNGDVSNNNTPTVTGTAEPGSDIVVTGPNGETCSTQANQNGDWSCVIAPGLTDGSNVISVTATDAANNESAPATVSITIDTQAPAAPVIITPTNGAPVSGTGEPGATVIVTTPGGSTCTAEVQPDGTWSCTLVGPPSDGEDVTAIQEDEAGNTSPPVTVSGGIDTVAPAAPVITAPVDGDITNNNTPTVTGTADPGANIVVTGPNGETCSTQANQNGDWSCVIAPGLTDGSNEINVTATDAANNESAPAIVNITVDTQAPTAPVIITPTNGAPVTGTGEPGATVTVTTPGGSTCTALVQPDGTWSCTLVGPPINGEDITAEQEDEAGNTSPPVTVSGGIDTVAPAAPVITAPVDGDITNNNTPTVTGTADPGANIVVTGPNGETCSTQADQNGDWSCVIAPALGEGANTISVVATDDADNDSLPATVNITVDTVAPDAPVITTPTNGAPVTGTGEPGATVTVTTPGGSTCTALVQPDGTWSCTLVGPPINGEDITAEQEDEAGNTSPPVTVSGGIDTVAPAAPVITSPQSGITTNDNNPVITGTGEPDSTITVTGPNGQSCETGVDQNGDWSCTLDAPLQDGQNTITAVASDDANNASAEDSVTINIQNGVTHTLAINFDGAELVTTEMGDSDTFTVALTLTPTADVTVNLSSSNTDEGTVAPSSLTFTTANWNVPQTVTVTGVDDTDYDLDQDYQIITSALVSSDSNYSGVDPADVDAVNIDDDEMADISAFLTNCEAGIQPDRPLTYYLTVRNEGNKDISGAAVTAMLGDKVAEASWVCEAFDGATCGSAMGTGDINTTVDLVVGSSAVFTMSTNVTGQLLDFIDSTAAIAMPLNETDVDLSNNDGADSDLIYQFIFKHGFDCAAPGTPQSTNDLLMQILNQ